MIGIGDAQQAERPAVHGDEHHRLPASAEFFRLRLARSASTSTRNCSIRFRASQRGFSGLHISRDALARDGPEVPRFRRPDAALLGAGDDGGGERVFTAALQAGGQPEQLRFIPAGGGQDGDQPRLAFGERAGLVHDERVHLREDFERLGVLDEHAGGRAAAHADHDRHRRGQAERAGTGDDEDRDGVDERMGQARLRAEQRPDDRRKGRDGHDRGHEPRGDGVGQPLDRARGCAGPRRPFGRSAPAGFRRRRARRASRSRPRR